MSLPAKRQGTYDDLIAIPDHLVGELIAGELITSPRPAPRHTRASSRLGGVLDGPFDRGSGGPGGWIILDEPELHLDGDVVVPDVAGWRRDRMPKLPDTAYFGLAPDWVCEVLSPSTEGIDRSDKMPIYAREGVPHAWLVNPITRTLENYRLRDRQWVLASVFRDGARVRAEPFDALELDLALLWAD